MDKKERILGAIWSSEQDYNQYCELTKQNKKYLFDEILKLEKHLIEGYQSPFIKLIDIAKVFCHFGKGL